MGKRWARRWTSSGKGHRRNDVHATRVKPTVSMSTIQWPLPPSKSHLIRVLLLAAQSSTSVMLLNTQFAGEDARSMRRCVQQLGVKIEDIDADGTSIKQINPVDFEHNPKAVSWLVHGVGPANFTRPASVLSAGNSGTALRLLATHAAMIGGPVMLDGDASLRRRSSTELWDSIEQSGVTLSVGTGEERLPALFDGPMDQAKLSSGLTLDISRSSQPLSSWILAAPSLPCATQLSMQGKAVSSRHSKLSLELLKTFGGMVEDSEETLTLLPTALQAPNEYTIPGDASMAAFGLLACAVSGRDVVLKGWPSHEDAIGHEVLEHFSDVLGIQWKANHLSKKDTETPAVIDLRDANDLLPPLAAVLALNQGGQLKGAAHAAFKESNRLTKTVELLAQFGLVASVTEDGLSIEGHQEITKPLGPVQTHSDHRLFMTAVLLASSCGADVIGQSLHKVADEPFLTRLSEAGFELEFVSLPPMED
jgi:3-phosphoshikimate 1-carboxyvinyltransferase